METKQSLLIAKALRLVCKLDSEKCEKLYLCENIDCQGYITSYWLKATLLAISHNRGSMRFYGAYGLANEVYRTIKNNVLEGNFTTMFGEIMLLCEHGNENLWSDDFPKQGCCLKRRLVLILCRKIEIWFYQHLKELNKLAIDYDIRPFTSKVKAER